MTRRIVPWLLVAICACFVFAPSASAQRFGLQAGASDSPDQFYLGLHYDAGRVADELRFRPSVDAGFGSGLTRVGFNLDFLYGIPLSRSVWSLYVGAGPAIIVETVNNRRGLGDSSQVRGGAEVLLGMQHRDGFFTEIGIGLVGSPSIMMGVGVNFRR